MTTLPLNLETQTRRNFTNPKNGEVLTTHLTFQQAYPAVVECGKKDSFAADLAKRSLNMSKAQEFWFYKKAQQFLKIGAATSAPNAVQLGEGFHKIQAMFQKAATKLKRPRIVLQDSIGNKLELSLAATTSKNPGYVYLKKNGAYCGKISPEGALSPTPACDAPLKEYIRSFADNPAFVAKEYSVITGNCCFCARILTDPRSLFVGYGPVCADHFGLPYGEVGELDTVTGHAGENENPF